MKRLLILAAATALAACSAKPSGGNNRDTMTQRQKDSVFGASGVPGAAGVGQAQAATDSINAQRRRVDSAAAAVKPDTGV